MCFDNITNYFFFYSIDESRATTTRGQALRMLIGGGEMGTAIARAAAEVDDISKIDEL